MRSLKEDGGRGTDLGTCAICQWKYSQRRRVGANLPMLQMVPMPVAERV